VTQEKIAPFLPPDVAGRLDNSRRGAFVFHTALTGRCAAWGWPGDLTILLPQWVFFGEPRTMGEAFDLSQVSGGYTTAYIAETFRSRWPHPSLYASWDLAPIWPMSIIWGPVDYYGVVLPCGYYYKRAQEPLHVLMQLKTRHYVKTPVGGFNAFTKIYQPGDEFAGQVFVVSDLDHAVGKHTARMQVFDSNLHLLRESTIDVAGVEQGPSSRSLGAFTWSIPKSLPNQVALVCVSLRDAAGKLVSRSAYPVWISSERDKLISDVATRRDHGPWLTDLKKAATKLKLVPIDKQAVFSDADYLPSGDRHCARVCVEVTNTGSKLAFQTGVEITNADCRYICDDNYFVLMPGETRRITFEIDRNPQPFYECVRKELVEPVGSELEFTATAWNAPAEVASIPVR
jgi:beta-mannosidase